MSTGSLIEKRRVHFSDFVNFKIPFPSKQEQEKISSFLSKIDNQISQLAREIVLLNSYKKGVMQKIFNQEIRFKNDVSGQYPDWETKSLGDIGTFQTSSIDKLTKDNERKVFLVNYMNVYRHENINNNSIKSFQIVSAKDSQIQSCNLKMGDILFTPSSETPDDIGHSVVISEDLDRAVYSYHLMRFRPKIKIDIKYSHYFCNTQNVLAQLTRLATGATRFTISIKSFSTIQVQLPCIEEQQKIASLFIKLDEKISNVQKQLELTKQYKQGLLQQMFV
jgi:type I restriction enzyme S subunit